MFAKDVKVGEKFLHDGMVFEKIGSNPTRAKLAETDKQAVVGPLSEQTFFFRRKEEVQPV